MGDLNKQAVERLKPPAEGKGNSILRDGEVGGFGVCCTPQGVKSFFIEYRIAGRQRRYTIGRVGEWSVQAARARAIEIRNAAKNEGTDPLTEKAKLRNEPLMEEVARAYLYSPQFQKLRPGTQCGYRSIIEGTIIPKFGSWRVPAIRRQDIEKLHVEMKETPYQANRTLAMWSTLFTYAKEEGLKVENPVLKIERYHEVEREAWLTEDQMRALDEALNAYATTGFPSEKRLYSVPPNPDGSHALRLMVLTGARMGEVLKSRWEHFDLERGKWKKPAANVKQKSDESIPLGDDAVELLLSMKPHNARGPLFPGTKRKNRKTGEVVGGETRVSLIKPWIQVCKRAGLAVEYEVPGKRIDPKTGKPRMLKRYKTDYRRHDLRHNFASYLASNRESLQIIGKRVVWPC